MSTTKKNSNGALDALVPTVIDGLELPNENGDQASIKSNGKSKKLLSTDVIEEDLNRKELLRILSEVRNGNFIVRMPVDAVGMSGKICDTLNEIIALNE